MNSQKLGKFFFFKLLGHKVTDRVVVFALVVRRVGTCLVGCHHYTWPLGLSSCTCNTIMTLVRAVYNRFSGLDDPYHTPLQTHPSAPCSRPWWCPHQSWWGSTRASSSRCWTLKLCRQQKPETQQGSLREHTKTTTAVFRAVSHLVPPLLKSPQVGVCVPKGKWNRGTGHSKSGLNGELDS